MTIETTRDGLRVWYDGKPIVFRKIPGGEKYAEARGRIHGKYDVCPLCREKMTPKKVTMIYLMIGGRADIPNRHIHAECLEDKTIEYAFSCILERWQEAQKYSDWFDL